MIDTRKCTQEDIDHLAPRLRKEDLDEIRAASGLSPREALMLGFAESEECHCIHDTDTGEPVAVFGVVPMAENPSIGIVWMLGSDDLKMHSMCFLRRSAEWVQRLHSRYPLLCNVIDARNEVHVRWLQWLGFQFIRDIPDYGPEQRLFYEFVRLNNV